MDAQFRLLGEVGVVLGGSVVDVGHARQRCVLAALAVDANRLVPVEHLVDRVWSERPPAAARNTLAGYVSRIRQLLAPAAGVSLARRTDGYLLEADPLTVDLHRFRHLSERARAAGGTGEALALYEDALALWRGEPFAGLDSRWLDNLRVGLDTERLEAELDRNDLALGAGRHAQLLSGLLARVAAHPLHERLTGQLMLALYRSGRQAEALQRYQRLRTGLAEELGADPSPPLRRIHQQLLTDDEAEPPPRPPTVPRQLPARLETFTGRAAELAAMDAAAADRAAAVVVAVTGTAGVGKTALAVYWARRAAPNFGDGQLYVDLRGFGPTDAALSPGEAVRGFLETLGVPPARIPAGPDAQIGLYRSLLAGRRMLIVLDNARDAGQIRPLLPGGGGCLVVVTSRDQLTGLLADHDARPVTLDLFSAAEARALLARRLGPGRVGAEPGAVDRIVAGCHRLPLALAVITARAVAHPAFPLAALAGELAEAAGRLDATDARTAFSWSYRTLGDGSARLFRWLGLHPGPDTGVTAAASLVALPPGETRPLLAELTRAHLLNEPSPGRFTCHDLLREYAAEQAGRADAEPERRAALHRVLDHYLHTAHACAMLLHPHRDPIVPAPPRPGVVVDRPADAAQALSWFTTERPVLLAAATAAAGAGLDTHAWQLAWAMWTFLDRRGHHHDMLAVGRCGLAAADRLADPAAQAPSHRLLAAAYVNLERFDDAHAHLMRALELYREVGDLAGQAHVQNNLSTMNERQHRYAEALHHGRQALDLYRAAGHRRGEAHGLNTVGWYQTLLGDHEPALVACRQALTLLEELDDRAGQAYTWDSLGHAHRHLGHHREALDCLGRARRLLAEIGDRYHEANIVTRIGDTHHDAGDGPAARAAWREALAIVAGFDHADTEHIRARLRLAAATGGTPG